MEPIRIKTSKGERLIGPGQPVFVIAEISGNHNQDKQRAFRMIDAAVEAGADAVKLQTYTADTLTIDSDKEYFKVKVNDGWKGQTLYSLYQQAYTPWEWQKELKQYADERGIVLFSTPFDETAVDFLEGLDVQIYKVASFESTFESLLKYVAKTKKPVIISKGLTSAEDISRSLTILKEHGCPQAAVLHCISAYPAPPDQMNVQTVAAIPERFGTITGLSDHSLGTLASTVAVSLGASIIEKHFTLDRLEGGPDASFSLEPKELKELVDSIRSVEKVLGKVQFEPGEQEKENLVFRRSIFVIKDMKKGETFTEEHIRIIRPGYGMEPRYFQEIIGKTATKDLERGEPLHREDVAWN